MRPARGTMPAAAAFVVKGASGAVRESTALPGATGLSAARKSAERGVVASTTFTPIRTRNGFTLAKVVTGTGRKHQIRAHAEFIGHRVAGDKLYGPDPRLYLEFATHGWTERHSALLALTRQALHCAAIDLRPARMDYLLRAPWPADLARFAARDMNLPAAEAQALIDEFVARVLPAPPPREAPVVGA